jgi:hypothetical protein
VPTFRRVETVVRARASGAAGNRTAATSPIADAPRRRRANIAQARHFRRIVGVTPGAYARSWTSARTNRPTSAKTSARGERMLVA